MSNTLRPRRLHYLDADDIVDERLDFSGLDVRNAAGEKLGNLDGFVVDRDASRPYYAVVDSGGWISSQQYLVPIGHARLDTAEKCLRVDLAKDTLQRYPAFDRDRFTELDETEARRFTEQTLTACCPTELAGRVGESRWEYDSWSHYQLPDWWQTRWLGARSLGDAPYAGTPVPDTGLHRGTVVPPVPVEPVRERVIARDHDEPERDDLTGVTGPVAGDRAQPGDILGIERGGEVTQLGDTREKERERLRDSEEAVADDRGDELEDRTSRLRDDERAERVRRRD